MANVGLLRGELAGGGKKTGKTEGPFELLCFLAYSENETRTSTIHAIVYAMRCPLELNVCSDVLLSYSLCPCGPAPQSRAKGNRYVL